MCWFGFVNKINFRKILETELTKWKIKCIIYTRVACSRAWRVYLIDRLAKQGKNYTHGVCTAYTYIKLNKSPLLHTTMHCMAALYPFKTTTNIAIETKRMNQAGLQQDRMVKHGTKTKNEWTNERQKKKKMETSNKKTHKYQYRKDKAKVYAEV